MLNLVQLAAAIRGRLQFEVRRDFEEIQYSTNALTHKYVGMYASSYMQVTHDLLASFDDYSKKSVLTLIRDSSVNLKLYIRTYRVAVYKH